MSLIKHMLRQWPSVRIRRIAHTYTKINNTEEEVERKRQLSPHHPVPIQSHPLSKSKNAQYDFSVCFTIHSERLFKISDASFVWRYFLSVIECVRCLANSLICLTCDYRSYQYFYFVLGRICIH